MAEELQGHKVYSTRRERGTFGEADKEDEEDDNELQLEPKQDRRPELVEGDLYWSGVGGEALFWQGETAGITR